MMKLLSLLLPMCLAQPDWCRWVPLASQVYVPECSGYVYPAMSYGCGGRGYLGHYKSAPVSTVAKASESGCKASCQWLSRPSWKKTSDCAKCEQPVVLENKSSESEVVPSPKLKVKTLQPDWCKWVPVSSLQYVGECNVAPTQTQADANQYGGCAGWCGWSPVSSWQYIAECRQCSPGLPEATAAVPMASCVDWGQWGSQPSWQYVGSCAGCEALVQAQNANANEIRP
eukprot:Skav228160  [mRNA]  locus=scaffold439:74324:75986:+ [translate_table: standard]